MSEKLIAIKGFQMPEDCVECVMQCGGWCGVAPVDVDERVAPTVDEAIRQGKPEWCPLVEIEIETPTKPKGSALAAALMFPTALSGISGYMEEIGGDDDAWSQTD